MKALLLIIVPLVGAALAALWPSNRTRPWLLPVVGLVHVVLVFWLFLNPPTVAPDAWLGFDPLARAVLPAVSLLFLVCAAYGVSYLRMRSERPNRVFVASAARGPWLVERGTSGPASGSAVDLRRRRVTLAAVPLLHFNGTPRAFEATWKYLLVGGTGIALSLLGSFCLGYASLHGGGGGDLTFAALTSHGRGLVAPVGADRVGVAARRLRHEDGPRSDAHLEARRLRRSAGHRRRDPGGRRHHRGVHRDPARARGGRCRGRRRNRRPHAAGHRACSRCWWRRCSCLGTRDFKRMLAYSSVEHMGILSVGAALGAAGVCGGAVSCLEQRPDQGRAVSERGQHPPRGRFGFDGRRARHVRRSRRARRRFLSPGCLRSRPARPSVRSSANCRWCAPRSLRVTGPPPQCFSAACCSRSSV